MPFEKGNQLGVKAKLFDQALRRAIASDDGKRVRDCADKLLDLASTGEPWAVKELIDRLDGKAVQTADININDKRADELSDSELLRIAAASRTGTSEPQDGAEVPSKLH